MTTTIHHISVLRRYAPYLLAMLALAIIGGGTFTRVGGVQAIPWWINSGWTCCGLAALGGCLVAARRDPACRRAWILFAAACATWTLGQMVWNYNTLVAHIATPFPSLGDAGWLGFVPFFAAGLFALPRHDRSRKSAAFLALDFAIVGLALALIAVVAVQNLLVASTSVGNLGKGVALAYPVAYLTLGLITFLLMLRVPSLATTRGMALLLAGLICEGSAFVAWAPLLLNNTYQEGSPLDLLWMVGLLAIMLGGLEWRPVSMARKPDADDSSPPLAILGLVPTVAGIGAALGAPLLANQYTKGFVHAGADSLIVLIALRQIAAVIENAGLYQTARAQRRLAQQHAERLKAVQEVTQQLHLNLDPIAIAQIIVDMACAALGYRCAILNLITNPTAPVSEQRIKPVATAGLQDDIAAQFLAQDAPASDVLALLRDEFRVSRSFFLPAERAPSLLDATEIPHWSPPVATTAKDGWRSGDELLIPLWERRTNNFMGFLSVDDPIDGRRPTAELVEILETFTDQAALAIENSRLYERAQVQALRDPVTDLANHRAIHQALDQALAAVDASPDNPSGVAFMLVDINNFKLFNDTYGHPTGDAVLRRVADILRTHLRENDVAGRYGGDEFAVVLPGIDNAAAHGVAARIVQAVASAPYVADDGTIIPLSASIGVAAAPQDGTTRQALLAVADARMYAAKSGASSDPILTRTAADLLGETTFGILEGLVAAVDAKDRYTREHSLDVTRLALMLAEELNLDDEDRRVLAVAGPLHDVGKIAVPDRVLRKPGSLTDDEYAAIKTHVTYGVAIISGLLDDARVIETIAYHHERYDGRGYPFGIRGDETPLLGRILQIADAVSAMTLDRPYRRGLSTERVITELRRGAGAQFDPMLVEPFIRAFCQTRGYREAPPIARAS